jgi:two-component system cell cycle response regulator DivK
MPGAPILVVDDAPVNLKLMRLLLTHEGYDVRTAERAEDALQMLSNYRPDLILADIQLPGMNGLEMTRQVKADPRTSTIRVVALTACAMKEDRERALSAGCEDYISKPIDTSALASKVRELLERPASEQRPQPEPPSPQENALYAAEPEMEALRRIFLDEGAEKSRQLLDSLNSGFDPLAAAGLLHQWIGSAALLGHTDVSALVRKGEEMLRREPVDLSGVRVLLTDLFLTFSELRSSELAPVPDYVMEATTAKRIALIGFTAERADAMCTVLERAKARPRLFGASDDPASEAIRDCDLVLFHVRPETLESSWLQPDVRLAPSTKLVLTGERNDLMALSPQARGRALDFIVGRSDAQEMLMRISSAILRNPVVIPEARPKPAVDVPVRSQNAVSCPNIVLADDDGIIRSLLSASLHNHGMSCRSFDNGLDALNQIRQQLPHAAVLDVNMPGMNGYEVLAAIRMENLPVRVILLTSLMKERDIVRAFNLGADDYVTKPFNPFELVARLKRLLQ